MANIILTADQARDARISSRLSQAHVASELQINRTYLSLFESGKYLFDETTLRELREYYEHCGYDFGQNDEVANIGNFGGDTDGYFRSIDGFVIHHSVDETEADLLLTEFEDNNHRIEQLAQQEIDRDWFGWIDEERCEKHKREMLHLMARNFIIIEWLHGREALISRLLDNEEVDENTIGGMIRIDLELHKSTVGWQQS